jgi:hypothetical protein
MKVGKSNLNKNKINEKIRNVTGYSLTKEKISDKVYFKHIQNILNYTYAFYKAKFHWLKLIV